MRKKSLALVIALAVTGSSLTIPAFAAIKAGSTCTTKGQIKTSQGKKFTCIKSGTKLIWNKGVAVRKPTPTPTATPSPTVTPSPSPTSTQKIESPQPASDLENGYVKVFSKLNHSITREIRIDPIFSPTVNTKKAASILENFSEAVSLYKDFLGPNQSINLVFMSELDESFYKAQVSQIEGPFGDSGFFQSNHCTISSRNYCAYGSNKVSTKIVFYQFLGSEMLNDPTSIKISNYHEAVHMYQQSLTPEGMYSYFPPWFVEGQATFLGNVSVLNFSTFKAIENLRNSQIKGLIATIPELYDLPPEDLVQLLVKFETDISYVTSKSLGYNLGMLLSEYLYIKYGPEAMNSLILSAYKTRRFDQSVREILKVEKIELYKELSIYVLEQLKSNK